MNKKLNRQILASSISMFISVIMLAFASFAWLSANRQVESNGMQMNVDTTANLVISSSTSFTSGVTSVSLTAIPRKLKPAMHVSTGDTKLQAIDLSQVTVNKDTGIASANTYVAVPTSATSEYYIDYIVYIASEGKALTSANLTASFTSTTLANTINYNKASSIDFYVDDVYADTINLAGLNLSNDTTYDSGATKTVANLVTSGRIPCRDDASGNKYLKITMRCYFDGALHDTASSTYVRFNQIDTTGISLGVLFTATGTEADHN